MEGSGDTEQDSLLLTLYYEYGVNGVDVDCAPACMQLSGTIGHEEAVINVDVNGSMSRKWTASRNRVGGEEKVP